MLNIHKDSVITDLGVDDGYGNSYRCVIIDKNSKNYMSQLRYYLNFLGYLQYPKLKLQMIIDLQPVIISYLRDMHMSFYISDEFGFVHRYFYDTWGEFKSVRSFTSKSHNEITKYFKNYN